MNLIESIVALGFLAGMIYTMVRFGLKDIHKDLQNIRGDISDIKNRIDKIETKLDKTESRIDHLYQICIEMLGTRHKN